MSAGENKRCWVEIDLAALERNLGRIRNGLPPGIRYVAVVKADAYGHGIQPMATRLMQSGAELFAVANVEEARQLRELGSGWPILILSPVLPAEQQRILEDDLIVTISSMEEVERYEALARDAGRPIPIHLKVDTGMGRVGVWYESAEPLVRRLLDSEILEFAGIYTHFACAVSDPDFTQVQRERLLNILNLWNWDPEKLLVHADNSAALETFNRQSPVNAIRIGLLQCGILPYPDSVLASVRVEPVLSLHARVSLVKEVPAGVGISYNHLVHTHRPTRVAVLTAGYGDGIPVSLSNRGKVLLRGRSCPILGRICMDQIIVDATDLDSVAVGDPVTLIGSQGDARITLSDFAHDAGTIPYEILTSVTKRVTRVYKTSRDL